MNDLLNILTALVITAFLSIGSGKVAYEIYDTIKKETLDQISEGLSSTEALSNALSDESLSF